MSKPPRTYSFEQKNVLVTGASGGLGSAIVQELASVGANLIISCRSLSTLDALIHSLPAETCVRAIAADLGERGEAGRLAGEAVRALGRIDVLFNIAGIGYFSLMEEASEENIRHLFEVNTFSPLLLIKHLLPPMKESGGGRIINIVSCAGRVPIPTVGVYGGSKSALAVMANTMRIELAPAGIDLLNIYPGTTATAFEENALREEARPGLCPRDACGLPRFDIARRIMRAAGGPAGEIWLERQGLWLSRAGLFFPGLVDRLMAGVRARVTEKGGQKKRHFRLLQVESARSCNLRCIMCPWGEMRQETRAGGIMSEEIWEVIRPHLHEAASIDFTGGGEPLLQPHLSEWIAEAKAAGCETGFLTNGLLLKEAAARRLLSAGVDWIGISMDGATAEVYEAIRKGSRFDAICRNVSFLAGARQGKTPRLLINFVLMAMNSHQAEEIVRLAVRLGVDGVNFKQCDVIRGNSGRGLGLFARKRDKEIARLEREVEKARRLARESGIETSAFSFTPEERAVCVQDPRNSVFIRYDGAVSPCINLAIGGPTTFLGEDVTLPTVVYGHLPEQSLEALWETPPCRLYRERFQQRVNYLQGGDASRLFSSPENRRQLIDEKKKNMPEPAPGCGICHYLYDI
jgi:short-subunit dehydrogenase/MoaA/NifB/PqqE/SkfB family radical SAM enzyme